MKSCFFIAALLFSALPLYAQTSTDSTAQSTTQTGTQPAAAPPAAQPAATSQNADELPDAPTTAAAQVKPAPVPTGPTVVMDTSMGRITCKLFEQEAPVAVANFIGLAEGTKDWTDPATHKKMHGKSLYDGTLFHRVIPGFMIQGGDPTGTGAGDPGYYFNDELNPNLNFDVAGRLAMANSGPNTNGSQFFITEQPNDDLDQRYTIFGQCDPHSVLIVQSIARVPRDANDKPLTNVVLDKVTIVRDGEPMPPLPAPATSSAAPAQPESPATPTPQ